MREQCSPRLMAPEEERDYLIFHKCVCVCAYLWYTTILYRCHVILLRLCIRIISEGTQTDRNSHALFAYALGADGTQMMRTISRARRCASDSCADALSQYYDWHLHSNAHNRCVCTQTE